MRLRKYTGLLAAFMLLASLVAVVPLQPAQANSTIEIVGLGDSFTAGNGALDYQDDCYRSPNAYVHQLAAKLKAAAIDATSSNFACSGAVTGDIAAQISQASGQLASADLVTLTIGGNDADFGTIVVNCLAVTRLLTLCHDNIDAANALLDTIVAKVKNAVSLIGNAAPGAHIVLVGYPYLVEACDSDFNIVRSLQSGVDAQYQLLINAIDQVPLNTAGRVHYASMLKAFEGGGVCGTGPQLIRGSLDTFPTNFMEWWHPNVEGHAKIAEQLFAAKANYGISVPSTPPTTSPAQPPTTAKYEYGNLPLACGVVVAKATTYGTYTLGGVTFSHGKAIDLPVGSGTKVVSPASGTAYVKWDGNGYGRFIDVVDGSGKTHRLAHMQEGVVIGSGAVVTQGQLLGYVGATGAVTGPHLHYEQRNASGQVALVLDGPDLVWSNPSPSGGDQYTLHSLTSKNCGKSGAFDEVKVQLGGEIREIQPVGKTTTLVGGISGPKYRVECDLDGDGLDEMYSVEYRSSKWYIMRAKIPTVASRSWTEYASNFAGKTIKGLSCGDVNGNGIYELKVHLAPGGEIRKVNYQATKLLVSGISSPLFRVECDTNGDGKDEVYSLEKKGTLEYRLMQANFTGSLTLSSWTRYVHDKVLAGRDITAMSCGDRDANGQDELKLFFKDTHSIVRISHPGGIDNRQPWVMWNGLTTPKHMVECDANNDGVDELYSVEYRGSKWFVMRGTWGKSGSLKSWKQYSVDFDGKAIKWLSCGNRNGY